MAGKLPLTVTSGFFVTPLRTLQTFKAPGCRRGERSAAWSRTLKGLKFSRVGLSNCVSFSTWSARGTFRVHPGCRGSGHPSEPHQYHQRGLVVVVVASVVVDDDDDDDAEEERQCNYPFIGFLGAIVARAPQELLKEVASMKTSLHHPETVTRKAAWLNTSRYPNLVMHGS